MNEIHPKIKHARINLLLSRPFYGSGVVSLVVTENSAINTANTDGKRVQYNPDFISALSNEEVQFVFAHELLHILWLHHTRVGLREPKKWNRACDYVINDLLLQDGFKLVNRTIEYGKGLVFNGCLHDLKYRGMSAEEVYSLLPDSPEDGNHDIGGIEKASLNQDSLDEEERRVKEVLSQAIQATKRAGTTPGFLDRLIDHTINPKVNWEEQLARFMIMNDKSDYNFTRPNTRYLSSGFLMPSLHSIKLGNIVFAVDTSGSIDVPALNIVGTEMLSITSQFNIDIDVLYVDTEVANHEVLYPDHDQPLQAKGGGGTSFIPPFEYVEEHGMDPICLIYFTDGYCNSYPDEPEYPVLWAVHNGPKDFEPPFGEVLRIELDN